MSLLLGASPILTPSLARQGANLRLQLDQATHELTTGKVTDTGAAVGGDFRALAGIDAALARIEGYAAATAHAGLVAETMQAALAVIDDSATALFANMTATTTVQTENQLSVVAAQGATGFTTAVAMLNTRIAGQSLFGGINPASPPLPDADVILTALEAVVAGAATATAAQTAIAGWFADPAGFAALYAGGDPRAPVLVAGGETVDLGVTALDPGLRQTLQGLATMALLDRGLLGTDHEARRTLGTTVTGWLASAAEGRSSVATGIGIAEQQIADASARNAAEKSALSIARNGLVEADPYETATRLQDLETRLDAFYTLLSRLSRLSLTEYI